MHFEGSLDTAQPRDRVWAFVTDPDQVGRCAPGVEGIEVVDEAHFRATGRIHIGFIGASFVVDLEFAGLVPPVEATIKARGRAPGSAVKADARLRLSEAESGGTTMDWSADVDISGAIGHVGVGLIEGTANKMIGQTFDCMKSKLEGGS